MSETVKKVTSLNWALFWERLYKLYAVIVIISVISIVYSNMNSHYSPYTFADFGGTMWGGLCFLAVPVIASKILQWLFKGLTAQK
jgi:hypothetical protein